MIQKENFSVKKLQKELKTFGTFERKPFRNFAELYYCPLANKEKRTFYAMSKFIGSLPHTPTI